MKLLPIIILLAIIGGGIYYYLYYYQDQGPDTSMCSNGVKDELALEEGIDCGGPCEACPTCNDTIQNQEEAGVDCGGPCEECMEPETCEDNIKNQDEEGIDCGGVCEECKKVACDLLRPNYESIAVTGNAIDASIIKDEFLKATEDYQYLDTDKRNVSDIAFNCHWGNMTGERVDLYYCSGNYTTVRLNRHNIIVGPMFKKFNVGFDVLKTTDLDANGKTVVKSALFFTLLNVTCYPL